MTERLYLAYTCADAQWLASQSELLDSAIVYSGIEPHSVFRSAGTAARDAVDFYQELDFATISSQATELHHQFEQTLGQVGTDYGLSFDYRDVDVLACSAHILWFFFYEAVVSYYLAAAILRTYNPKEIWVNQSPLTPITHWGERPVINYENQVWSALRNTDIVVKPLGNDIPGSCSSASHQAVQVHSAKRWLFQPHRSLFEPQRVAHAIRWRTRRLLTRVHSARHYLQGQATRVLCRNSLQADVLFALQSGFWRNYEPIGQALASSLKLKTLAITQDYITDFARLWFGWRDCSGAIPVPLRQRKRRTDHSDVAWISRFLDDPRFPCAFSNYPVDIWQLVKSRVDFLLRIDFPRVCTWVDRAYWLFESVRPKLVVQPEQVSLSTRALATVARLRGAKTLVIAHGSPMSLDTRISGKLRADLYHWYRIYGETTPDYLAVWGPYAKRLYVEGFGWPADRIFITGWPWIERELEGGLTNGFNTKSESHAPLRFLLLTTTSLKFSYYMYEAVFEAAEYFQAQLLIRPHPGEDSRGLYELARHFGTNIKIDRSRALLEQIRESNVVLGGATSVLTYAIALGKPCIFIDLLELKDFLPYALEGAAIGVYKPSELIPAIEKLLKDDDERRRQREKQRAFTKQYLGSLNGNATKHIVRLVGDLLAS